jgi:hypothetical protein
MRKCYFGALAAAILALPVMAEAAQISGTVLNADGKPLAGMRVTISRGPAPDAKPFSTIVSVAADGTFEAKDLAAGRYVICPQPLPPMGLLAPCSWEKAPPMVTVTADQSVRLPAVQLKRGVMMAVRLDDPSGYVEAAENRPGAGILISVRTPGGAVMPAISQQKNNGYTYQLLVPADTDLTLSVHSQYFQIENSKGEAISKTAGVTVPVKAKQGSREPVATFTVRGGA